MLNAAFRLFGVDLQQQVARITERVEDAKQEFYREIRSAITELKAEAVGTGINIGLVVVAAEFAFLALIAFLVAIFLWIAPLHGPMPALLGIGLAMLLLACVLLGIARTRSTRPPSAPKPESEELRRSPIPPEPLPRPVVAVPPARRPQDHVRVLAPLVFQAATTRGPIGHDLNDRLAQHGAAAAEELAEKVEDVFRTGSRKAIVGTVLVTMLAGAVVGWRWRR
jgi:hypothetical protein